MTWRILQGDARDRLKELPDQHFHCCVTSPPFFQLRSYLPKDLPDKAKEIGGERTDQEFIETMVMVFREVRRVLRDDGVLFCELGDTYNAYNGNRGPRSPYAGRREDKDPLHDTGYGLTSQARKPLDLCNIPHRVAEALCQDGWYWRSTIIVAKQNPMPESISGWRWEHHRIKVKSQSPPSNSYFQGTGNQTSRDHSRDIRTSPNTTQWQDCPGCPKCHDNDGLILRRGSWRPTQSYTSLFMLTKTSDYFCDQEAVREAVSGGAHSRGNNTRPKEQDPGMGIKNNASFNGATTALLSSRNPRNTMTIVTEAFNKAHFAVMPSSVVTFCLRAGTSQKGCCPECGAPWARIIQRGSQPDLVDYDGKWGNEGDPNSSARRLNAHMRGHRLDGKPRGGEFSGAETLGWRPTCTCEQQPPVSCRVIDPFAGVFTTGLVADRLGLDATGIELNPDYCALARERLRADAPLFQQEQSE